MTASRRSLLSLTWKVVKLENQVLTLGYMAKHLQVDIETAKEEPLMMSRVSIGIGFGAKAAASGACRIAK